MEIDYHSKKNLNYFSVDVLIYLEKRKNYLMIQLLIELNKVVLLKLKI